MAMVTPNKRRILKIQKLFNPRTNYFCLKYLTSIFQPSTFNPFISIISI
jgi:hypothetical protein